jgi:hypothetical protein
MGKLEIEGMEPQQEHKLEQMWKLAEGDLYDATYVQQFIANTVVKVPGHMGLEDVLSKSMTRKRP